MGRLCALIFFTPTSLGSAPCLKKHLYSHHTVRCHSMLSAVQPSESFPRRIKCSGIQRLFHRCLLFKGQGIPPLIGGSTVRSSLTHRTNHVHFMLFAVSIRHRSYTASIRLPVQNSTTCVRVNRHAAKLHGCLVRIGKVAGGAAGLQTSQFSGGAAFHSILRPDSAHEPRPP